MVRTRVSNKSKRFTDFGALDGDDDHPGTGTATPAGDRSDHSDDNFAAPDEDSDVSIADEQFSDNSDDSGAISDASAASASAIRKDGKRIRKPKPPPPPPKPGGPDYHELPIYPLDPRLPTRAYNGPLRRGAKYGVLRNVMYGPDYHGAKLIWDLAERWAKYAVLPARLPPSNKHGLLPSPWVLGGFEAERERDACAWYEEYWKTATELPRNHLLHAKHGEGLVPRAGPLALLLGPVQGQKEFKITSGSGMALSESGLPVDDAENPDKRTRGWMFDVGGLPIAVGWAPIQAGENQLVALAVIPHSDQVRRKEGDELESDEEKAKGSIQFWQVSFLRDENQRLQPSSERPRFVLAKCFEWGRPKRMQWCPVSFSKAGIYGLLAVLCGDGRVRVLDVRSTDNQEATEYELIETPMTTLGFTDNYNIEVTCFTWVGSNRLALGHTDGSITLWSIHPCQMLQRHAVHSSMVLDINCGYPSKPNMVASVPVGGFTSLIDLSNPTNEWTYVNAPGINFQPNVLDWNDHMQGWLCLSPAGGPGLNTLAFLNVRYFPIPKPMLTSMSMPLSISMHGNHPYGLIGCSDGSLWSFNALSKLFRQRDEDSFKIKILEHEFRPPNAFSKPARNPHEMQIDSEQPLRGASRFVQSFLPEINDDPRSERLRVINKERARKAKSTRKKNKGKKFVVEEDQTDEEEAPLEDISAHMASRMVIHEPLTRVSAVAWNPNVEFGTWAAVSFGSGLVRLIDVGVD